MKIIPTAGLCNYLRVLFSYYQLAQKRNENLEVIWNITDECPGHFLDYFQKPKNMTFIKKTDKPVYFHGYSTHKDFDRKNGYKDLKLKPYLEKIVSDMVQILGDNFIAIHVRRTDHTNLSKSESKYTSDNDFFKFIDSQPKNTYIYLATDNRKTQDKFIKKYGNRIKINKIIIPSDKLRQTNLEDAIIDLFVSARAKKFKGSGFSSFSDLINSLRSHVIKENFTYYYDMTIGVL